MMTKQVMQNQLTRDMARIAELLGKATQGPWKNIPQGGSSTILADVKPVRNDTRIPGYGYRDEQHCIGYPFLEDGGQARLDFVNFSHADAELIVLLRNHAARLLGAMETEAKILEKGRIAGLNEADEIIRDTADRLSDCGVQYAAEDMRDQIFKITHQEYIND